jgi:hypothetical protein
MATQPRLVPPAFAEWIAYSALWSRGQLKNSRDLGLLAGVGRGAAWWTCKVEHVVYVGGGNCHAVIFDEKESMCRGSMEDLLGSLFGRVGEVNDWYCCILVLGLRHLGIADKGICRGWVRIRQRWLVYQSCVVVGLKKSNEDKDNLQLLRLFAGRSLAMAMVVGACRMVSLS